MLYVAQYNKADVKRLIPGEPKSEGVIYKESCSIRTHLKHILLFQKHNQTHVHLSTLRFWMDIFCLLILPWSGGSCEL